MDESAQLTASEKVGQDDVGAITAEFMALSPTIQAALTAIAVQRSPLSQEPQHLDINVLIDLLVASTKRFHYDDIRGIEAGLLGQASTLGLIFQTFARRGCEAYTNEQRESEFGIAFRAQSQCRATLATLVAVKNPASVALVSQTNIAHGPQLVNNGGRPKARRTAKRKSRYRQSKQSGPRHELLPDGRASAAESRGNTEMEAVGEVHRAEASGLKARGCLRIVLRAARDPCCEHSRGLCANSALRCRCSDSASSGVIVIRDSDAIRAG